MFLFYLYSVPPQVLGSKPLNGNAEKLRLKLWDGEVEMTQAVLCLEGREDLDVPSQFSIIKLEGVRVKQAGTNWAAIISGYQMLRSGTKVGRKLEVTLNQVWGPGLGNAVTPPATSSQLASNLSTPAKARSTSSQPPTAPQLSQVKRNLAESFGSPEPKRLASGGQASHPVASITPFSNKFTLKVRVEQMGSPRRLNTRNFSGSVLDCVLTDASGQIKLTAWSKDGQDDVTKMEAALKEGGTYLVSGGKVKMVQNTAYNSTGHQYDLTWNQFTRVEGPLAGETVQLNYKFVPLAQVAKLDEGAVVDVIGWVQDQGSASTFESRKSGREVTKREVVLADTTGTLVLTLWAEKAKEFKSAGKVIAVRGAKVQEFQGVKNIQTSFGGSYEVEPKVEGLAELVEWGQRQTPANANPGSVARLAGEVVTLSQVQEAVVQGRAESKFTVAASPTRINQDNLFYRAHNPAGEGKCRKKVQEEAGLENKFTCRCGSRGIPLEETVLRYMVRLCLADCSTYEWAIMFDAETLFGCTAQQLHELREASEEEFQKKLQALLFVQQLWTVGGKMEAYQGENRVKLTLLEARKVDWEEKRESLWEEIVKMENELEISHEEEWGYDLTDVLQRMGRN